VDAPADGTTRRALRPNAVLTRAPTIPVVDRRRRRRVFTLLSVAVLLDLVRYDMLASII
jgi:hypothetical protein